MAKIVGMLRGKEIYDNELTSDMQCDVSFIPVQACPVGGTREMRCDYCGRTNKHGEDCASCGAPSA